MGSALPCAAQNKSPVDRWDLVLTGPKQEGLAVIEFFEEGFPPERTFSGYGIFVPKMKGVKGQNNRAPTDPGRGTGSDTNAPSTQTNLFLIGPVNIDGRWNYDAKGRIIGTFSIEVTNFVTTNVTLYSVSFTGKAVPGRRLTLVASTSGGRLTFRGVPYRDLTDLSFGVWNGIKKEGKQMFVELFSLWNRVDNSYEMVIETAPDYTAQGFAMVSAQKKMAFALEEIPPNAEAGFLRASIGPYREAPKKTTAKTKGFKEPDTQFKFDAVKVSDQ